ncbi:cell wall-binding repeat-containing protein [Gryllotalpicola koreensis]|uniref:Cell wall-binding repeat-containing protein n=1 Tax=Gryllotalpicola koreensis TaxID=993086 RepID=A0ABP7ZTB8_9MICO
MRSTARRRTALSLAVAAALALGASALVATPAQAATTPPQGAAMSLPDSGTIGGVDASKAVDWSTAPSNTQFAYIEATVNGAQNSSFFSNWAGATQAGIPRGAYAFGQPNKTASNGATQATYFYNHGAQFSTANKFSLPPVLDLEEQSGATTNAASCWNLSVAQQQDWVTSFVTTFKSLSGIAPVIYTTSSYWKQCVGNPLTLNKYPLWVADVDSGTLGSPGFGGATAWKFRQFDITSSSSFDYDEFHGTLAQLQALGTPRIAGPQRWDTGAMASTYFPAGTSTVYVASGANFPDALSAGAAAGKAGAPVLLVNQNSVAASVIQALQYLKPTNIVVVGGTTAVSSADSSTLAKYGHVTRVSGADRFATSSQIATSSFPAGVKNAYIAVGANWPDALSGSALAASQAGSGPMLLVQGTTIPASVASALAKLKPQHITILGGTAAVSQGVQNALASYTAGKTASAVTRISGADRFATSATIAAKLASIAGSAWDKSVYVASGTNFPDALVGAPTAALTSSPVLLTMPTSLSSSTSAEITKLGATSFAIMGGPASVGAAVQSSLNSIAKAK